MTDGGDETTEGAAAETRARRLLRDVGADRDWGFDPETVAIDDAGVLEHLSPVVRRWWVERFGAHVAANGGLFTPPQRGAIPHVAADRSCLVAAPTGSGKTLAAFTAVLDDLFARDRAGDLENAVYCLYVSPLKSLANDVERNLESPLAALSERIAASEGSDGDAPDV
ncbi:DEAD/DEAH box helicase, partial [Halorubrum halodurans]